MHRVTKYSLASTHTHAAAVAPSLHPLLCQVIIKKLTLKEEKSVFLESHFAFNRASAVMKGPSALIEQSKQGFLC